MRFPWGLFRPVVSEDDTLASVLFPLVVMGAFSIISAVPIVELKGSGMATTWVIVSFIALCFFRRWMFARWAYQTESGSTYISPSDMLLAELTSTLLPAICWIGISFGVAYQMWGWGSKP